MSDRATTSAEGRGRPAGLRDVLFFVEDPGGANFVAPLLASAAAVETNCVVLAVGLAAEILRRRGVPYREVTRESGVESALAEVKPRLVVVGTSTNPDTLGLVLVAAARREGIPSVGVVDAAMNSPLRFRGRGSEPLAFAPDWVLVPDERVAACFVELGLRPSRVIACGNPHYDHVIDLGERWRAASRAEFRRRVFPHAPPDRPIVVFAAEGSARVLATRPERLAAYALAGRGPRSGRTEIALEELLEALPTVSPRPYLVLRAHPKDHFEDYAAYSAEIDVLSASGDSFEIIFAADLVVGTTSMIVTEAALLERPTIAIVPLPEEESWLPSVQAGRTPVARTRDDLTRLLRERLGSQPPEAGLRPLQGSRERALAALQEILRVSGAPARREPGFAGVRLSLPDGARGSNPQR